MKELPFELTNDQDFAKIGRIFADFCKTIAALRDPGHGCPWDLEQDHKSLRSYMIEEACEASQAMGEEDQQEILDELGDVLLQVVLNAQVAKDSGTFDITGVIHSIQEKMIRRHPHIFGNDEERGKKDVAAIKKTWDEIKIAENKKDPQKGGYFEKAKVKKVFPASTQALKIGRLASRINFDWNSPEPVYEKFLSEVRELGQEWKNGQDREKVANELGDVYFSLAQLCRHLNFDPEIIAASGNQKFLNRFRKLEELAVEKNIDVKNASQEQLEGLWQAAKEQENHPQDS